jgi:dTDP-4-dehydrorhamnose reductase
MNIVLLGRNGQVGFELVRVFAPLGNIHAPSRQELDLTDADAVASFLKARTPMLILNAAAYTAVDRAESEPSVAAGLNAELPRLLAEYGAQNNAQLVHYSSDYVYPGDGDQGYDESSATGPLSVYGQTKLDGDLAIAEAASKHWIFRTSWVYSARGNNFMKTMIRLGKDKSELKVVVDQVGAPTPARLIAQISLLAYVNGIASGVYHLAPRGETSWQGFAQAIFEQCIEQGCDLAITPNAVRPIPTADYPTPAKRPLNSRLNVIKIEQALGIQLPHWRQQLNQTLEECLGYSTTCHSRERGNPDQKSNTSFPRKNVFLDSDRGRESKAKK